MEQTLSFADRVLAGAALLDRNRPGWYYEINLKTLNIEHCGLCVLGQLYGDYFTGLYTLDIEDEAKRVSYGFTLPTWELHSTWIRLTQTWKELIQERLAADLVTPTTITQSDLIAVA